MHGFAKEIVFDKLVLEPPKFWCVCKCEGTCVHVNVRLYAHMGWLTMWACSECVRPSICVCRCAWPECCYF